jgi:hypothetical protein
VGFMSFLHLRSLLEEDVRYVANSQTDRRARGLHGFRRSSCISDEEWELEGRGMEEVAIMKEHEKRRESFLGFRNAKAGLQYEGRVETWSLTFGL